MTHSLDDALKPCPFCAAVPDIEFSHEAGRSDVYEIECPCGISVYGPCGHEGDAAKAATIRKWNTRAALEAAGVAELREENERLRAESSKCASCDRPRSGFCATCQRDWAS